LAAAKTAFRAFEDAVDLCKMMPGMGTLLVDIADASSAAAEGLIKSGASLLLGSSIEPLLEASGGGRLFDLGAALEGKDEALCSLVQQVVSRLKELGKMQVTIVPFGWLHSLQEQAAGVGGGGGSEGGAGEHASNCMLLVIRRTSDVEFSVAVCNTGQGRELHARRVATPTGQEQVAVSVCLRAVPAERIIDGSFWYLLLRPLVYPSAGHTAEHVYRVLPFLNQQPLTSKEQTLSVPPADWVRVCVCVCACLCVRECACMCMHACMGGCMGVRGAGRGSQGQ